MCRTQCSRPHSAGSRNAPVGKEAAIHVVRQDQLPLSVFAREFIGDDQGGTGISLLFVDAAPGQGPSLHTHPYDEILIFQAGRATARVGDEERELEGGDVVLVPAGVPHTFVNSGDAPLRQIDIHVSPRFVTDWLGG